MRERGQTLLPSVLALVFTALLVTPLVALGASGLPATVTMNPEAAGPGSTVEITGLEFPANQAVDLQLTTTAGPMPLGSATTEEGGYFRQEVVLPADAPIGYWELRASAPDGSVAVYLFEADSGAIAAAAVAPAETSTAAAAGENSLGDIIVMLVFALLIAGVGGAILYVYVQSKGGTGQPGMSEGADLIWSGGSSQEDPEQSSSDEPAWKTAHSEPLPEPTHTATPR